MRRFVYNAYKSVTLFTLDNLVLCVKAHVEEIISVITAVWLQFSSVCVWRSLWMIISVLPTRVWVQVCILSRVCVCVSFGAAANWYVRKSINYF